MSGKPSSSQLDSGAYGQLLALATTAQGDRQTDKTLKPMSEEDRKWLEEALNEFARDADPVRKLKVCISSLNKVNFDQSESQWTGELNAAVQNLIDLVCDLDLALDFCKLGGLKVVEEILSRDLDKATAGVLPIVSEIGQNNPPVQKELLKAHFLEHCLQKLESESASDVTKIKSVSAVSCIVKAFPPAVIHFVQLDGHKIVLSALHSAIESNNDNLVRRCVIALANIGSSAAPEVIDKLNLNTVDLMRSVRSALAQHADRFSESIEYLDGFKEPEN